MAGEQMDGEQHRHSEEPGVGQGQLSPVHRPELGGPRSLVLAVAQGVADEQRSQHEPESRRDRAAGRIHSGEVGHDAIGRADQHHTGAQQQVVRPAGPIGLVDHSDDGGDDHHRELDDGVHRLDAGRARSRQRRARLRAEVSEQHQDGERDGCHQPVQHGGDDRGDIGAHPPPDHITAAVSDGQHRGQGERQESEVGDSRPPTGPAVEQPFEFTEPQADNGRDRQQPPPPVHTGDPPSDDHPVADRGGAHRRPHHQRNPAPGLAVPEHECVGHHQRDRDDDQCTPCPVTGDDPTSSDAATDSPR